MVRLIELVFCLWVTGAFASGGGSIGGDSSTGITVLTDDVIASGPGPAAATVVAVGGSLAAAIHTSQLATAAATSGPTPSTLVARDVDGGTSFGGPVVAVSGVVLATVGLQPTCDSSTRGTQWVIVGDTGVADSLQWCKKKIDDTYAWSTITSVP